MPIGVFDSGVGGISVLRHISKLLPSEDILYVADSLYAPYGTKSADFIQQRAFLLSEFLISKGATSLVVACNTATAAAVCVLRDKYSLPIIGMEPAVKPAAAATRSGVIGVLATTGTLQSAQFAALLESYGKNVRVVTQACLGLVECIERGELEADTTRTLLQQYISPLLAAGADTIVLGCTHYPFVRPLIEKVIQQKIIHQKMTAGEVQSVTLIDTGAAVAKQLQSRLQQAGLLSEVNKPGKVSFWTNSQDAKAAAIIQQLWASDANVTLLPSI